jgi:hypothetical protein
MKKRGREKKEEHYELFENPKVVFKLKDYEDIFSDFDPRPYKERALSSDFLNELKLASADKRRKDVISLNFSVHSQKREESKEKKIEKRLRNHFNKHYLIVKKDKDNFTRNGVIFSIIGVLLMLSATYLIFSYPEKTFIISFLVVLLEPGGWFLFWEGLDMILFKTKEVMPNLIFYEKMKKSRIRFLSYH